MFDTDRFTARIGGVATTRCEPLETRLALQRALGFRLLAGLTVGALLALAPPAEALELGDARVTSTLGQPLTVEIPYKAHTSERLTSACVSLVPAGRGQLPAYTQGTTISTRGNTITVRGTQRVLDPLIGLNLRIRCSSAPHIVRSYELFVNPAAVAAPRIQPLQQVSTAVAPGAPLPRSAAATVSPRARGDAGSAIVPGQTYTVLRGDTLSGIAARIAPRDVSLSAAVDAVFAANPDAFDRASPDLLHEGATLTIPTFGAAGAVNSTALPERTQPPSAAAADDAALTALATSLAAPAEAVPPPVAAEGMSPTESVEPASTTDVNATASRAPSPFVDAPPDDAAEILSYEPAAAATGNDSRTATASSPWLLGLIAFAGAAVLLILWLLASRRPASRRESLDALDAPAAARPRPAPDIAVASGPAPAVAASASAADVGEFDRAGRCAAGDGIVDSEIEYAPQVTAEVSALDLPPDDGEDPLAISSVDLDIGEALAATGIDIGTETAALDGEPSTITHATAAPGIVDPSVTVAEMDMLARDYEAEFTATQELSRELAVAVADLKRSQGQPPGSVVPDDETLITTSCDVDRTAVLDVDEPTAYLEDSEAGPELRWDARTEDTAKQLTDDVLSRQEPILGDATAELPVEDDSEPGNTVEMPPSAERAPWQPVNDDGDDDRDPDDWPAFREASKRGSGN